MVAEAIARANALPDGLGANVYTRRMNYILRCLDELEAGTVWFNDPSRRSRSTEDRREPTPTPARSAA
jgi:acyl-CoA reductase-like NAD-dependent aldehyde dehydrogenase